MNPRPNDAPELVLLIIADISGYTRYMTANAKTLAHSQAIITELIQAIVHQIELPLEVAKLEGDAIFFYCRKQQDIMPWSEARRVIGGKLIAFFSLFDQKLAELSRSTTCTCNACTHIEKLRLKIVVHSGEALFLRVLNLTDLAGVDVIIVHRLLKNSVSASQYLLLTESARQDLDLPATIRLVECAETYEDIGRVNTFVYLPEGGEIAGPVTTPMSFAQRFHESWDVFCKLWFAPFVSRAGKFSNVETTASAAARIGFALLTAALTPISLPVGTVFVFFHALKSPSPVSHAHDGHIHKPDT